MSRSVKQGALFPLLCLACESKKEQTPAAPAQPAETTQAAATATPAAKPFARGLVLALSQFAGTTPKAARAELLTPGPGLWKVEGLEDSDSNVFHKAFAMPGADGKDVLVTL